MIIHGGLDSKKEILNDFWAFDLVNYKWFLLPY